MSRTSEPRRLPRCPGSLGPLFGVLIAGIVVIGIVLLALGEPGGAAAAGVLLGLLLVVAVFDAVAARRKLGTHRENPHAVAADDEDEVPAMPIDPDAPMGATSESHADLDPHDFPPGHPGRRALEGHHDQAENGDERSDGPVRTSARQSPEQSTGHRSGQRA